MHVPPGMLQLYSIQNRLMVQYGTGGATKPGFIYRVTCLCERTMCKACQNLERLRQNEASPPRLPSDSHLLGAAAVSSDHWQSQAKAS